MLPVSFTAPVVTKKINEFKNSQGNPQISYQLTLDADGDLLTFGTNADTYEKVDKYKSYLFYGEFVESRYNGSLSRRIRITDAIFEK